MSGPYDEYLAFAHELADAAAPVLLRYFRKPLEAENKADHSPVTEADREVERLLRGMIAERYPDHAMLGEEYGAGGGADASYCWVLDPIDGTRSFLAGKPLFGCLIGLSRDGIPVAGVLDQPFTRERWQGAAGQPSLHNGAPINARNVGELAQAVVATTSPYLFAEGERVRFERLQAAARFAVFGGDCYAYGLLAMGGVDVVMESGLKAHDFAALVPILEGAGAVVTDWRGNRLSLASDGTMLAAATPALHRAALDVIGRD